MRRIAIALGISLGFGALLAPGGLAAEQDKPGSSSEPVQVIEMTAKKYEYNPSVIRVKKSTRVALRIRALDRTHGFKISLYPEGSEKSGPPGLRFDPPQDNWKIEKDRERVIEFVAERPGTYPFKCSNFCGFGHGRMKGELVVEE